MKRSGANFVDATTSDFPSYTRPVNRERTTIYVELLDEGTECWRPVLAEHINDDLYRIEDAAPEGEVWAFHPGEIVRCKERQFTEGNSLTAFESVTAE